MKDIKRPFELKIGIVGVGRVGGNLAYWLRKSGAKLSGIFDKDTKRANEVAKLSVCAIFSSLEAILNKVDIVIFSTNDDSLLGLLDELFDLYPFNASFLFHTSGSLSSKIFAPLKGKIYSYSFHPMCSIASLMEKKNPFENLAFAGEGDVEAEPVITYVINSLGGRLIKINSDSKTLYHAGCCLISNLLIGNLVAGENLLKESGLKEAEIKVAIKSLSGSVINNYIKSGFPSSLTGPIARGDAGVITRHLIALGNKPEKEVYESLTKYIENALQKAKENENR